jgi:hypothetical protein
MPDHPHGTIERYREYPKGAARCQPCRDAWAAHQRQRRADARAEVARRPGGEIAEGEGARLARLWAAERDAGGERLAVADVLGDQADDLECDRGHPVRWTTDHTVLICEQCPGRQDSPGTSALADALEAERKRQVLKRGEVAPRLTPAEARRARVQLHAARRQAEKYLGELLADLKHAGDLAEAEGNGYLAAQAEGLYDLAEGYQAEIADADTLELLRELLSDLDNVRHGGDFGTLMTFVNQRQLEAENRRQLETRQAEQRRREAEAEREARQLERQRQAEQRRQLASAQAGQRSLNGAQARTLTPGGYAEGIAMIYGVIHSQRQAKERLRERNGECGWCKKTAERLYAVSAGVRDYSGNPAPHPSLPQARACKRHFTVADQWIESQRGQWEAFFWELSA